MAITKRHKAHFLFLNESDSRWARFAPKGFKHVMLWIEDSDGVFMHLNPYMPFCMVRSSNIKSYGDLLKRINRLKNGHRLTSVEVDDLPTRSHLPFGMKACQAIARCVSGVDVGFVFNCRHLYDKLLQLTGLRNFNVTNDLIVNPPVRRRLKQRKKQRKSRGK